MNSTSNDKEPLKLSHLDVCTCFNHFSLATAVLRGVSNTGHGNAVHENGCAAFGGDPVVGPTAFTMFSRVTEAKYWASVDKDVRGTARGGSADAVGTTGTAM
jgi:hypothetical protein